MSKTGFLGHAALALLGCIWSITVLAQVAPNFDLPTLDRDSRISLGDLQGKVVYVDFWASWCGPCSVSFPYLERLRTQYKSEGFEVVAINLDADIEDAKRFLQRNAVTYPVLVDDQKQTPVQFGVKGMPTAFLLDRAGNIRHVHTGFRSSDADKLARWIEQLLLEKPTGSAAKSDDIQEDS